MANDPTYITVEEVSGAVLQSSGVLTNGNISAAILMAEGVVDSVMQMSGRAGATDFTFAENKHGLIKETTKALACLHLIAADVEKYSTSSSSATTADIYWSTANRNLGILSLPETRKLIKEL